MSCACDDVTIMHPYRDIIRVASQPHRCTECGTGIARGARYHAISGLLDGHWQHLKVCAPCLELLEMFRGDCHVICFGNLGDQLADLMSHHRAVDMLRALSPQSIGHATGLYYRSLHAANTPRKT